MSTPLGEYTFVPWIKTGLGSQIDKNEKELNESRAKIGVELSVKVYDKANNPRIEKLAPKEMALYGPGDIVGILETIISRTDPKPNESNFEANYFPHIEFSQPDFPWRITPARPNARSSSMARLMPWLCLFVLKREEFDGPELGDLLLQIKIKEPDKSLLDLEHSWAWNYCQITRKVNDYSDLKNILISNPHLAISGILCARRLEPNTTYYAFLVPSFEAGRLAGLGKKVEDTLRGTEFAWKVKGTDKSPNGHPIPIYFQWQFSTGESGDFETLVKKLDPRPISVDVGQQDLEVSNPSPKVSGITKPLGLGGVLMSLTASSDLRQKQIDVHNYSTLSTGPNSPKQSEIRAFIMDMKEYLDLPERYTWSFIQRSATINEDPIIAPPIYGKWHAERMLISKISQDYQDPEWIKNLNIPMPSEWLDNLRKYPPFPWLEELNLDPSNRVAAGFGTVVIQEHQEDLMASAWDQVGAVIEANKRLRLSQLARTLSDNIFEKTLKKMDTDVMIETVSPLHGKVTVKQQENTKKVTVFTVLAESPIPNAFFSPSFKKITSRRGKIHRKLFDRETHLNSYLLNRFNKDPSNADPNPATPDSILTIDVIFHNYLADPRLGTVHERDFPNVLERIRQDLEVGPFGRQAPEVEKTIPLSDSTIREPETDRKPAQLEDIRRRLIAVLDPNFTIETKDSMEIIRPSRLDEQNKDKLDPILAYPKFRRPMFESLREISRDILLPGADYIPENTISILKTNPAFINSYMVGLNHEMAKELLWRGYPTDQRGTYFRQFWDVSVVVERDRLNKFRQIGGGRPLTIEEEEEIVEKYCDIKEIHKWKDSNLIRNYNNSSSEKTVLIIKGDLLRRYPTAVIYAIKAIFDLEVTDKNIPILPNASSEQKLEPIFRGSLHPDIVFFGFEIPPNELVGKVSDPPKPDDDPGWFFVIQEQPSEPRFGLDERKDPSSVADVTPELTSWSELSWDYMYPLSTSNYIDVGGPSENNRLKGTGSDGKIIDNIRWRSHSADMANITLQQPVRIAIHSSKMISTE